MKQLTAKARANKQFLVKGDFDSKRVLDPEVSKHLFGFLAIENGDGDLVDVTVLVNRSFRVVQADDRRLYLEELEPGAGSTLPRH